MPEQQTTKGYLVNLVCNISTKASKNIMFKALFWWIAFLP
jgi:hypothetical protein